jgi:hypothetical protein
MATPDRARAFDHMLLITYSVRPGSVDEGYEDWLRRVDNPFFNVAPGFAHYGNWKVCGGSNPFAPHLYFDFVGMKDRASFDVVWNGAEVNAFRREWRRLWGVQPGDPGAPIQTCRCERTVASEGPWSPRLALAPGGGDPSSGWETWQVFETLRGSPLAFDRFGVRYGDAPPGDLAQGVLLAECIAAPELGPA